MREKILLIEDDAEFSQLAVTWLTNVGYEMSTAEDGINGIQRVYSRRPDLVLLDVNIPKIDGWEVCRRVRDMSDIPVVMLTVCNQISDRLKGFRLGADDYITKPVDLRELTARVQSVLRRSVPTLLSDEPSTFDNGELEIEWRSHQVYVRGKRVKLSPTEFRVLSCLVKNRGWIVTHEQILEKAWGPNYIGDKSFVKLYIRYLRKKIEEDPRTPRFILSERGVGYYFSTQSEEEGSTGSYPVDEVLKST